jgi:hypothetical protein
MAHPKGPSGSKRGKAGSAPTKDLSADDFERLATIFRPSWKLDDAPFTAGGTSGVAGGPAHPQDQNGTYPIAAAPIVLDEAPFTTIVGTPAPPRTIPPDAIPGAPPRPAASKSSAPPAPAAQRPTAPSWHPDAPTAPLPGSRTTTSSWPAPPPQPEASAAPVATAPEPVASRPPAAQPAAPQPIVAAVIPGTRTTAAWPAPPSDDAIPPAQRPTVPSWSAEADRSPFTPPAITPSGRWASPNSSAAKTKILKRGRPSRKPMWIGLAVAAAAAGAGLWLWVAAGNDAHPSTSPAPSPPSVAAVEAPVRTESPPPVVSAAAPVAPEPPAPKAEPPAPKAEPPAPKAEPPAPKAEPPAPTPPPAVAAAPQQTPPHREPAAAPAAPRPAVRPKPTSQTIVHDVPF